LAAVADEAPQILDAVGGVAKPTNLTSDSTPVAAEYGELFADASAALDGLMARAYGAVIGGAVKLLAGYRRPPPPARGRRQAQTKPNLIGYMEGAPPLPSENLTVDSPITPYKYLAASVVTLTDSDDIIYAYTASRETAEKLSSEAKLGFHLGFSESIGIAVQ